MHYCFVMKVNKDFVVSAMIVVEVVENRRKEIHKLVINFLLRILSIVVGEKYLILMVCKVDLENQDWKLIVQNVDHNLMDYHRNLKIESRDLEIVGIEIENNVLVVVVENFHSLPVKPMEDLYLLLRMVEELG